MIDAGNSAVDPVARAVRLHILEHAAATGEVLQARQVAERMGTPVEEVASAIQRLAAGKALILAPNGGEIWAAPPFCAVPSGMRVAVGDKRYWGICIWEAMGVVAAVGASDATVRAPCGCCGDPLHIEFSNGELSRADGVIHFGVPARRWWENIAFA